MNSNKLDKDPDAPANILIIEDDTNMRRVVRILLETHGYRVTLSATASDGLKQAESAKPDLILFDLGLPDCDGVNIIPDLRNCTAAPIIVVTGRTMPSDKIPRLMRGQTITCASRLTRVSCWRVYVRNCGDPWQIKLDESIEFGDVKVDFSRRIITRNGERVQLTPTEFRLISVLLKNADKMLTKRQLMNEVWGPGHAESAHYLRTYIVRLRNKLEEDPVNPKHILTETGMGYRFVI
jgi:two-component system KDP operon response regulator KdpE